MRERTFPRRLALAAVAVGIATPPLRQRLRLPTPVTSLLSWQAPLALALAVPRSPRRDAALYTLQMWAYIAHYEMPNDDPKRLRERLRIGYPIGIDRALGGGSPPTVRLQRALGRPGKVRPHDTALAVVHWSWFAAPHLAIVYVLLRDRPRFGLAAARMAAVFDIGAAIYFAAPTAPPWWAAAEGTLEEPVRRIMAEAGERFWGRLWGPLFDSLSGNQFAAMPSLHFATSVMAAHVLTDSDRRAGVAGWTYAAALGFALVYLGEHYVVDLVAGLALTEGVQLVAPHAARRLRPLLEALRRAEPPGGR